jgi:hypothetical protein
MSLGGAKQLLKNLNYLIKFYQTFLYICSEIYLINQKNKK